MSYHIEIENRLQEYIIVKALQEYRETQAQYGDGPDIEAIESLIEQFENQPVYQVLVTDE